MRDGLVTPSTLDTRRSAASGWKIVGWYESILSNCFDYGSPIHYRVYGTVSCTIRDCGGVRPVGGTVNGHPDYYTGFCIGRHSTSFGFIGANASLTVENCYSAGAVGTDRMGLYLFGYIGDTWIKKFEDSQLEYGVFIDGADASGVTLTALTAHQDVRVQECVLDAHLFNCVTVQNINAGGSITVGGDTYCSLNAAGDAVLVNNAMGTVSIPEADIVGGSSYANYGVRISGSKRVSIGDGVKIKDCRVGLRAESSSALCMTPIITRANTGGTNAVELAGVGRSYLAPVIDGINSSFDYCITADSASNYSEINLSGVLFSCLTTTSATRKIWSNGATWGGGGTFGNNNIATGVLN